MAEFKLDKRQQEAVDHTFGPLLVIAGAGSGKTRVLTNRIARLVNQKHAKPQEILAVTFTNKAAKEMRQRIAATLSKYEANQMTVCTFHSLGLKILREFGQYIGLHSNFSILSDNERISTLKSVMRSAGKTIAKDNPVDMGQEISLAKNGNLSPDDFHSENPENRKVSKVYSAYYKMLKKRQAVDFDDLLLLPLKLFQEHKEVLEKFRSRYKFVSIDEFQDTNSVQLKLGKLLIEKHKNLMVVGDDDQGIYSWRGAKIENILLFSTMFKNTKTVILNKNYRSTREIVDGANAVVSKNHKRKPKDIKSAIGSGTPIVSYKAEDEQNEVEWIVKKIMEFDKNQIFRFNEQALLFRTNAHMRRFEEELRIHRIPYHVHGGNSFFDKKEVKDIFAYLNFFANQDDELSLSRVLKVPDKGIVGSTLEKLEDLAGLRKISLWQSFEKYEDLEDIVEIQVGKTERFVQFCREYIYRFENEKPTQVLRDLIQELNYIEIVKKIYKEKKSLKSRLENIEEVISSVEHYEFKRKDNATLTGFIQNMALRVNDSDDSKPRGVTLMTLHKSKGLEFPVVYMPILDDAVMPSKKAREEGLLEEERRLFYVGMTRAKRELFLTFPREKIIRQSSVKVRECRFLYEIPEDCLSGPIGAEQDEAQKEMNDEFFAKMQQMFAVE